MALGNGLKKNSRRAIKKMSRLSSNPNIYNTCLNILREQGFEVSVHREDASIEIQDCLWYAKLGEFDFYAGNPIELLGLATILNKRKPDEPRPYWWRSSDDADIYDELVDAAYPETLED